jgi:hypothetical protein
MDTKIIIAIIIAAVLMFFGKKIGAGTDGFNPLKSFSKGV